jgi:hypothetical protein
MAEARAGLRGAARPHLLIAIAAAFWWLYFDVVALVAERRLADLFRSGPRRVERQRDLGDESRRH